MEAIKLYQESLELKNSKEYEKAYSKILECVKLYENEVKKLNTDNLSSYRGRNRRSLLLEKQSDKISTLLSPSIIPLIPHFYSQAAELAAKLNIDNEILEYYHKYQEAITYTFTGIDIPKSLYTFRSFSPYALDDLLSKCINVTRPRRMNDPFDTYVLRWIEQQSKDDQKHTQYLIKSFDGYRIRSFIEHKKGKIKPITDNAMWAYYADEHRGFCIEYSFSKDFCSDNMTMERISYDDIPFDKSKLSLSEAFATKSTLWKKESEIRLITYNPNTNSDFDKIPLDEKSTIKAIYLGYRCPTETEHILQKIAFDETIPIYKMKESSKIYPYRLKAVKIN